MNPPKVYNTVSKLQFPMLRDFCASNSFISVAEASKLDQRAFGSLYHRGWLGHKPGRGFHATMAGRMAYKEYVEAEARHRKRPELPLSHYFDPIVYKLHREPTKLHVVKKGAAA